MIIVLIGYMGSGKSTIGRALADTLNYNYIDLDSYIESKENLTITKIFKEKGEIYFRKKESQYLRALVQNSEKIILSLGGGTPCYADNLDFIINEDVISIYLKVSISNLSERLFKEREHRPLISHLQSKEELTEFIGKHLFERSHFYSQAARTIMVDKKTVKDVLEHIIMALI